MFWVSAAYPLDHRVVHVPHEPVVHRQVPEPPVLAQVAAVPPLSVELAVREVGQLGQDVHEELEEGEEADDPDGGVRQGEAEDLGDWSARF